MLKWAFIVLCVDLVNFSGAFLLDDDKPEWDGLQVTWGPNPFNKQYFADLPRTVSDAVGQGFKKISDCDIKSKWRGARYVKDDDNAVVLLFDMRGYIAGIQSAIPKGLADGYPPKKMQPPFLEDGDRLAITLYFVDPVDICSTGRTEEQFKLQGTGTDLYLQTTEFPITGSKKIEKDQFFVKSKEWTEGKCFITMGKHFWGFMYPEMDCDEFTPIFLLYNNGYLNGFGFAFMTHLGSPRYEHPDRDSFKRFMKRVPQCLYDAPSVSTMHVYLTSNAAKNLC